jgi:hypothetical protein
MTEASYFGRAMVKRDWWPSVFSVPLSMLTFGADRILLSSRYRWARLLVPSWDAAYEDVILAEELLVGIWPTVHLYKRDTAFRLFFAPRDSGSVTDIIRRCRERGIEVKPGRQRVSAYGRTT